MIQNIVKMAACICAQDGIISQTELDYMYDNLSRFNTNLEKHEFDQLIDDYFAEEKSVKDYCLEINNVDKDILLKFCLDSASSDGLEPEENKAYLQAERILQGT